LRRKSAIEFEPNVSITAGTPSVHRHSFCAGPLSRSFGNCTPLVQAAVAGARVVAGGAVPASCVEAATGGSVTTGSLSSRRWRTAGADSAAVPRRRWRLTPVIERTMVCAQSRNATATMQSVPRVTIVAAAVCPV